MKRLVGLLLAALFAAAIAPAAIAHGDEKHGAAASESVAEPTPTAVSDEVADPAAAPAAAEGDEVASSASVRTLLSNLHPATVHFPIALLLVAALTEALAMARASQVLHSSARVMAVAGGIGAVVATAFGWIHTGLWLGGDTAMQAHRWIGTALAPTGLLLVWSGLADTQSRAPFRLLLFASALAVLVQGYLGGELGHGAGHLWKSAM